MIKAIKFATVPVRDQDRAVEFYTQKLGFRPFVAFRERRGVYI